MFNHRRDGFCERSEQEREDNISIFHINYLGNEKIVNSKNLLLSQWFRSYTVWLPSAYMDDGMFIVVILEFP